MTGGRKAALLLAVTVAVLLAAGSCSVAAVKDSVVVSMPGEISTLLSWEANDQGAHSVNSNVYDTLIRRETSGTLSPALATEWSYNDDNTEITFTLRKGVKFHNGDEMTADDVVFSFNKAIESRYAARMTGAFKTMEKIDDSRVKLILKFPYAAAIGCVTTVNCGIVNKKAYEADPEGFPRNPVGTGPYKLVEWKTGESIALEAFEGYYRKPAAIKRLTFRVISDKAAALVALETGQTNVQNTPATSDQEYIVSNPKLQFKSTPASAFYFLAFNNSKGAFAEHKALREAAAYAIDPEAILLGALDGQGVLTPSPIPLGVKFAPENFAGYEYNPEKSKQVLEKNGLLGHKIKVLCMEAGYDVKVTEVVVEQLRQGGFDAEQVIMERTAYLADVYTNSQYEIAVNSYTAYYPDADFIMYMRYHSKHLGGGNNFVMVNNPELDKLLDLARESQDDAVRAKAYLDACNLMKKEFVLVPICQYMVAVAAQADLKGLEASNTNRIYAYDFSW